MSRLPCPPQHIAQVPESERDKCVPYTTLPAPCAMSDSRGACWRQATEEHHVVRRSFTRSWAERDYALLYGEVVPVKVPVCAAHHRDCTENRAWFEYVPGEGFVFWTELTEGRLRTEGDPLSEASPGPGESGVSDALDSSLPSVSSGRDESGLTEGEQTGVARAGRDSGTSRSPSVNPGQSCPGCGRRVPYPKQPSSPTSAVWSMRMPADAKEDFRGIVDALAAHLGAGEERYGAYKAMLTAAVWALQVVPERVLKDIGEQVA